MDIIKEAVLRIERDRPLKSAGPNPESDGDLRRSNEEVRHRIDDFSTREVLGAEELARLRIYHSTMRDNRIHTAFTNLRTHVIQRTGKSACSIVVSAVTHGGGASFVAMNLAAAFASDSSGSAILMDCNFAGRRFEQFGDNESIPGITDYIDGTASSLDQILTDVGIPRLRLLGGGTSRGTQREYFTRPRAQKLFMELRERYENNAVIIDAPPVLISANANIIAGYCDAVLLVVPYGKTTQQDVRVAARSVPAGKLLGSVFNDVPHWRSGR
jgi:Mrp family chromosome partitioning ATPase